MGGGWGKGEGKERNVYGCDRRSGERGKGGSLGCWGNWGEKGD